MRSGRRHFVEQLREKILQAARRIAAEAKRKEDGRVALESGRESLAVG